jgi:hypothetical protein
VPLSETGHEGKSAAVAVPVPLQLTVVPLSVPCAVPDTFRPPAHVALKLPLPLFDVCSVTCHWKFVQDEGAGTTLADVHTPRSAFALRVVEVGDVSVLV